MAYKSLNEPMEEEQNMAFKEIQPQDLQDNVFTLIGKDWLVVCGEKDGKGFVFH